MPRLLKCRTLVAALTVLHLNPKLSDPKRITKIPQSPLNPVSNSGKSSSEQSEDDDQSHEGFKVDAMDLDHAQSQEKPQGDAENPSKWKGVRSDIGILTEKQFQTVVTKCIATLGKPSPYWSINSVLTALFLAGSPVGGDLAMAAGADTPAVSDPVSCDKALLMQGIIGCRGRPPNKRDQSQNRCPQ